MIFLAVDLPESKTLIEKLIDNTRPDAIIPLNEKEMAIMKDSQIVGLQTDIKKMELLEIDRDKAYIALCTPDINIDDVIRSADLIGVEIRIVRSL